MYSEFCCKVTAFLLNIPPQNVTNTLRGVSLTSLYVTNTLFRETSGLFCSEKARLSLSCLHISARRRAIKVLEHGAEAGWVGETAAKHDVCYRLVRVGQQLFDILQTGIADEGMWCLVGQLLHSAGQVHTAPS